MLLRRLPLVAAFACAAIALVGTTAAQAKTFTACKSGCKYKTIQKAVDASGKGDTVAVKPGTYKEGVIVSGHRHDKLTIKGSPNDPKKTKLIMSGLHGGPAQNAIAVAGADNVRLTGFFGRDFKSNGFYIANANGYKMDHLIAERDGEYGLFAFNSIGGSMTDSTAYYFNDSGFYVGQTPVQRHPKRTTISHVTAYLNVLGYSGTNSKYVDIKNSMWFNNGDGIVPELAGLGALPAQRRQPDHRQQGVLEQLQLLPGRAVQEAARPRSARPHPVPRRRRDHPLRRPRERGLGQPDLRQLARRLRDDRRLPAQARKPAPAPQQPRHEQRLRPWRHRPQRPRHRLRRRGSGELLRRQPGRDDDVPAPTARPSCPARRRRPPTCSSRPRATRASAG